MRKLPPQPDRRQRFEKPQSFVAKCESGERRGDVVELKEFARLYRRPVGWFLG